MIVETNNKILSNFYYYNGDDITDSAKPLIKKYINEDWLGYGRGRIAFKRKDYVFKIPYNEYGLGFNYFEADTYKNNPRDIYAKCRMFGSLLVMEYVEPVENMTADMPSWAWDTDMYQVGYTRAGKLVVYDYGEEF
jgi:hypothetical protein